MQALQRLLFHAFDPHGLNVGTAHGFQQSRGIGGVGLVALHVGADVLGRQQAYLDAQALQVARPVMGRAAGLHHHAADGSVHEPAFELASRQPRALSHLPVRIGHGQLEHALCEIHGDGSSIHERLLPVW